MAITVIAHIVPPTMMPILLGGVWESCWDPEVDIAPPGDRVTDGDAEPEGVAVFPDVACVTVLCGALVLVVLLLAGVDRRLVVWRVGVVVIELVVAEFGVVELDIVVALKLVSLVSRETVKFALDIMEEVVELAWEVGRLPEITNSSDSTYI